MSHFISKATRKVDLGEGDFVEIRSELGYEHIVPFVEMQKEGKSELEMMVPLLRSAIVSWNLKDESGAVVEVSEENIKQLKFQTLTKLGEEVTAQYFPSKKD